MHKHGYVPSSISFWHNSEEPAEITAFESKVTLEQFKEIIYAIDPKIVYFIFDKDQLIFCVMYNNIMHKLYYEYEW